MKTYNYDLVARIIWIPIALIFLLYAPHIIISIAFGGLEISLRTLARLGAGIFAYVLLLTSYRSLFAPFLFDEKGITNKFLSKNIFIAWDEIKYIGVGELHWHSEYLFLIYVSKVPLKTIYFRRSEFRMRQNKQHFFIRYREGLLEEISKYVDEEKIKDIDRIKNCLDPEKLQSDGNSMH